MLERLQVSPLTEEERRFLSLACFLALEIQVLFSLETSWMEFFLVTLQSRAEGGKSSGNSHSFVLNCQRKVIPSPTGCANLKNVETSQTARFLVHRSSVPAKASDEHEAYLQTNTSLMREEN